MAHSKVKDELYAILREAEHPFDRRRFGDRVFLPHDG
jgi:hypothetical protein